MTRFKFQGLARLAATIFVASLPWQAAMPARGAEPVPPPGVFSDAKVQQAFDSLVRQGAGFVIRTTPTGSQAVEIRLIGKQFDNSVIDRLRLFPDIETLRCLDAGVDDAFLQNLDQFPRLRILGLFNDPITDAGLAAIGTSKVSRELRQLLIGKTKITDAGLKSVAELPRLYLLEVSGTAVTDAGIAQLGGMERLKVLRFRNTAVTDKGMASLGGLKTLIIMSVGGSKVTDTGIAGLRQKLPGLVVTDEEITINIEERP